VHVDQALVAVEVVAAQPIRDLGPRVRAPGVLREDVEQVELAARERGGRAVDADPVADLVDLQAPVVEDGELAGGGLSARPAQQRLDARDELDRLNGLGR
jgi:hypothetical protein